MWTMAMVDGLALPSRHRLACRSACHNRSSLGLNIPMSSLDPLSNHEQITADRTPHVTAQEFVRSALTT